MRKVLLSLLTLLGIVIGTSAQDMLSTPLTLEATTSGDITFTLTLGYGTDASVMNAIEYKKNDGVWTTYTWGDAISVVNGDKVAFRGNNVKYYGNGSPNFNSHITSTADVYVYGNMMSLIHASDFATNYTMTGDWNFAHLFRKNGENPWDPPVAVTTIKSHPTNDIVLPATTLTNFCYAGLFAGCSDITRAPELPATTMTVGCYEEMFRATGLTAVSALPTTVFQPYSYDAEGEHGSIDCYMQMFQDCTSLVTVPSNLLPATTLVHGVYQNMFQGCTNLTTAPVLPATDLTGGDQCYTAMFKDCASLVTPPALPATTLDALCYMEMFSGCSSLATAPALPATTLAEDCYHRMFEHCTSLQKAPDLPATTLLGQVYGGMFDGCTSLNYVKCLATDIVDTSHGDDATTTCWLAGVAATGTFVKAATADWSVKTLTGENLNGIPEGWTVLNDGEKPSFVATETPLTFEATENGTTITITNPNTLTISYSTNGGTTWQTASNATITISDISACGTVQFRGDNAAYSDGTVANSTIISCDKDCYVYGNIMSLVSSTEFATATTLTANNTFYDLFDSNAHLKNHTTKDIVLPSTTLTEGCYSNMFYKCTALTKAPTLPATTLTPACYKSMFSGCTALTEPCELPATTMASNCYESMFRNCDALTNAPALPATTLADNCYSFMFYSCDNLTTVPTLLATTLNSYCYSNMFGFCKSLTTTPVMSATTLAENCCYRMYIGCSSLTTISSLPAANLAPYCYNEMFRQCQTLTTAVALPATTLADYCYRCMFQACTALTTPPALPASTLAKGCYLGMFVNTGLTTSPELPATALAESCYYQMFQNCQKLTSSPALPATTMEKYCYLKMFADCPLLETVGNLSATTAAESSCEYMFQNCTNLVTAPDLPATELATSCYNFMFSGCTKLENAPMLPATTLSTQCYQRMFEECTSLVTAPALPATNLAELCYNDMFWNCSALVNAPELPATKLADYCYTMMFLGCSNLVTAPDLPAATLTPGCYEHMFMNCNSLNYVKCLATNLGDDSSTDGWLTNVAATGTFVQAAGIGWSTKGTTEGDWDGVHTTFIHGIPAGWTSEPNATADVTLNSDGEGNYWATYYNVAGNTADANTTVYIAKLSSDNSEVELTEVTDKIIPAGNAVVLKSTVEFSTMTYTPAATGTFANNDLLGTNQDIATPDNTYMLVKGGNGVGFYHWTGSSIPAGRAYLTVSGPATSRIFIPFGDMTITGVNEIINKVAKIGECYDLSGRRIIGQPQRGIYVKDGKKSFVK